jgi:hypothetical protein
MSLDSASALLCGRGQLSLDFETAAIRMNQERATLEKKLDTFEQQAISMILELKNGNEYVGMVSRNDATGESQISTRRPPFPESMMPDEVPFRIGEIAHLAAEEAWSFESG